MQIQYRVWIFKYNMNLKNPECTKRMLLCKWIGREGIGHHSHILTEVWETTVPYKYWILSSAAMVSHLLSLYCSWKLHSQRCYSCMIGFSGAIKSVPLMQVSCVVSLIDSLYHICNFCLNSVDIVTRVFLDLIHMIKLLNTLSVRPLARLRGQAHRPVLDSFLGELSIIFHCHSLKEVWATSARQPCMSLQS